MKKPNDSHLSGDCHFIKQTQEDSQYNEKLMANQEQLEILKQGVSIWNKWRSENPEVEIDLSDIDFARANLIDVNFRDANLARANLTDANLVSANLRRANLANGNLINTKFTNAYLFNAKLSNTNLSYAKLRNVFLINAELHEASLVGADLSGANLLGAEFIHSDLSQVNLNETTLGNTIFSRIDLSKAHGLETITHQAPSSIGIDSIQLFMGKIPEAFFRGCGLSDWEIESSKLYQPDLSNKEIDEILYKIHDLRAQQSIQISPLFISYSHADTDFVEKLETYLNNKGIRFWRDIHNATAGRLEKQIDRAMRQNPTVILILSENSTNSDWVEHEARLARDLGKELGRDVLCPIALDASWKSAKWPVRLTEQIKEYNILDYSKWNDNKDFERVFNKMISGLDMFYKK